MEHKVSTTQEPEDTRLLIRYLLGDLGEEEKEKIEERYASDDNFYFKLLATEDELIDAYVLGQISPDDRARFEQAYLGNPYRLKKVESNKIFLELVTKKLSPAPWYQRPVEFVQRALAAQYVSFKYAFAALLLIGIFGALFGWLLMERMRLRDERAQWNQKQIEYERQIAALKQSGVSPHSPLSPVLPVQPNASESGERAPVQRRSPVLIFVLPRVSVRAPNGPNALKPLVIRRGTDLVRLIVDIEPNDYSEYKISLQKIGEDKPRFITTLSKGQPGFSARKIVINLPADLFEKQDYILRVIASDPSEEILANYYLQVRLN